MFMHLFGFISHAILLGLYAQYGAFVRDEDRQDDGGCMLQIAASLPLQCLQPADKAAIATMSR